MKRAHRKTHHFVWIMLPVVLLVTIWLGFSIHGSADIDPAPTAPGVSG